MWLNIIIISLTGTLSHFLYDLTNHNKIVGLFTSVNESTWEHIKIGLTPTILISIIDGYQYGMNPNYFTAKLLSLLTIVIIIPFLFYSYQKLTNKPILILDIAIFYLTIIISQYIFFYTLKQPPTVFLVQYISCVGLFIFFGFYLLLTLLPIEIELFKDPKSNKYGYEGHKN